MTQIGTNHLIGQEEKSFLADPLNVKENEK